MLALKYRGTADARNSAAPSSTGQARSLPSLRGYTGRSTVKPINTNNFSTDRSLDMATVKWGACRLQPFGVLLKSCMQDGFGDEKRRKITQENLADALGLTGVDSISKWVNGKGYPEKGRFNTLMTFLSAGEVEPARLQRLNQLREAYENRPKTTTVKLDTPVGTFNFARTRTLTIVAVLLALTPLAPFVWEKLSADQVVTTRELVTEWKNEPAWREIRSGIVARTDQRETLGDVMALMEPAEADALLLDYITALVDGSGTQKNLRAEFDEVLDFFERAKRCVDAGGCDKRSLVTYLGEDANAFWRNFDVYILNERTPETGYGEGLETVARWWQEGR